MLSRSARVRVPADLTSVSTFHSGRETDPRDVELAADAPDQIWRAVERVYATGMHPAISLCVRRHGKVVIDRAIGHTRGNAPLDPPDAPKELATPATPFCIFSASKAVTAMVIHHLDDRGLLHIGDRVVEYLPEFGRHGKEWVTIQHVLTHRAGIPALGDDQDLDLLHRQDLLLQRLCDAKPVSVPGRRLAYHAISGGFILGEIVKRVTGKDIGTYLSEEILEPLGYKGMRYGWPSDRLDEVARSAFTGHPPGWLLDRLARRAIGVPVPRAAEIGNDPGWLTSIVPSGNIVATADEACRFFDLLLHEGVQDGRRVFEARTVRRATTETAWLELDLTLMLPVRYGVGLMLGAEHLSVFGPHTPRAFGHLGFSNVLCWADPARQISVAFLNSGKPLVSRHLLALGGFLRTVSSVCTEVLPR